MHGTGSMPARPSSLYPPLGHTSTSRYMSSSAEIVELTELLQPAPEEVASRRAAVEEVTEVVQSIWPSAKVNVFGSFATGGVSWGIFWGACMQLQQSCKGCGIYGMGHAQQQDHQPGCLNGMNVSAWAAMAPSLHSTSWHMPDPGMGPAARSQASTCPLVT